MWLLSTDRAELHYFNSPEDVPSGYAILSHVWDTSPYPPEQTFQDVKAVQRRCRQWFNANPRTFVSDKIKQCCLLAARHGHKWVWIDTCCIDKSSSAELSEAINSMFRYYARADICYAFLADVSAHDDSTRASSFRHSAWHTRGWTLQELLAPEVVLFVSREWTPLGTKADIAGLLEEITGVPAAVLRLEQRVADVRIAQRSSWAAWRFTTCVEDKAYSLMGIFGVNMPTLYGEGGRAFQRLQEEIMKQSTDTSLFAWGGTPLQSGWLLPVRVNITPPYPDNCSPLLATSPTDFSGARAIRGSQETIPAGSDVGGGTYENRNTTFLQRPSGTFAYAPIITVDDNHIILVLRCSLDGRELGLRLIARSNTHSPEGPLYAIFLHLRARLVFLDALADEFPESTFTPTPQWRNIYISPVPQPAPPASLAVNRTFRAPFHVPVHHIAALRATGFEVVPRPGTAELRLNWDGRPPFELECTMHSRGFRFVVRLGRCCVRREPDSGGTRDDDDGDHRTGEHWATVEPLNAPNNAFENQQPRRELGAGANGVRPSGEHDCALDHVADWPRWTREFELTIDHFPEARQHVALSFVPSPVSPRTLVLEIRVDRSGMFSDDILHFMGAWRDDMRRRMEEEQSWGGTLRGAGTALLFAGRTLLNHMCGVRRGAYENAWNPGSAV